MIKRLFAVAWVWLMCATGAAQQPPKASASSPPQAPFRVDVSYVEVDASVTDAKGQFVRDLKQQDFEILEDGRRQTLSFCSLIDIPIDRAAPATGRARAVEADVANNAHAFDGRVYVLVLDDLHTHPLRSQQVRRAARRFIEQHFGVNDLAAVVHVSGRADASQNFTANPRLLLAAIDQFVGRKPRSATLERLDDFFSLQRPPEEEANSVKIDDPLEMERSDLARVMLETLGRLGDWMAGVRGRRKALVLFSEGIDYNLQEQSDSHVASVVPGLTKDAIASATRSNMGIYAVDPRGATALGDDVMEIGELPSPEYYKLELGVTGLQGEVRRSQDSLRVLAEETGGFAAVDKNDFREVFDRVVRDSSTYYVLGYHPSNDRRDGRFRKIEVRVRRPDVQVRSRKGYVAPRGPVRETLSVAPGQGTSAQLVQALQNPLPVSGLPLSAFAAAFKGDRPNASVVVALEIGAGAIPFTQQEDVFTNDLELSLLALNHQGKTRDGSRVDVPLRLRPQTRDAVAQSGVRLLSRVSLPPGRYQLRLAALEHVGNRVGSVHYDLQVPDFFQVPLAMSGLVLTSASSRTVPTPQPDVRLAAVLPAAPTTRREFSVGDDALALFVEVYQNAAVPAQGIDLRTSLTADDGRVVFESKQTATPKVPLGGMPEYGYSARVPIRSLAPGRYVLRVEVSSRVPGERQPVFRETVIQLTPARPIGASAIR
jgi:VWFA-related protein